MVLSSFIPSIYCGLLTGLSMVIALIAALGLLQLLITWMASRGPERMTQDLQPPT